MKKILVSWDLGATKCAAAIVEFDQFNNTLSCKKQHSVKISSCSSLIELTQKLEKGLDFAFTESDALCIGAAGHFDGHSLNLESGYPYPMCFSEVAKTLKWPSYAVIHDYAPIVCATFTSYMDNAKNLRRLNNHPLPAFERRVALGIGTGLGLKDGVLFPNGDFWLGRNEMGHIGITTPPNADGYHKSFHKELMLFLRSEHILEPHEPLTFEKILTGQGMVRLHQFLYPAAAKMTPEELGNEVRNGIAPDVLAIFAWYLGLFVGTVQLSFMPEGGIWITGGVVLNHLDIFDCPEFLTGIYATPSYSSLRQEIPLGVLCGNEHAFMGAAYYATHRLIQNQPPISKIDNLILA